MRHYSSCSWAHWEYWLHICSVLLLCSLVEQPIVVRDLLSQPIGYKEGRFIRYLCIHVFPYVFRLCCCVFNRICGAVYGQWRTCTDWLAIDYSPKGRKLTIRTYWGRMRKSRQKFSINSLGTIPFALTAPSF